jgi:hypothetical protein
MGRPNKLSPFEFFPFRFPQTFLHDRLSTGQVGRRGRDDIGGEAPYLVWKGDRFYFGIRIPEDLGEVIGKAEHSEALGDVTKAQAEVLAAQHGANWQERFLRER